MIYVHKPIPVLGARYNPDVQARRVFRSGRLFSHLIADDEPELIKYATKVLGMRPEWIQKAGTYQVHFDITGEKLAFALNDPTVKQITVKEFGRMMLDRRPNVGTT